MADDIAKIRLSVVVEDEPVNRLVRGLNAVELSTKRLQKALEQGKITQDQFNTGTSELDTRINRLRSSMDKSSGAIEESRKSVGRWSTVTQQAGYQAGDFIVQIQSGTNAFVAFGQQATQMVGFLPLVAKELGLTASAAAGITLGLSIAIPVITAIGAALMRSGESTKKAKEETELYAKAIQDLASEIQKNQDKFAKLKFGGEGAKPLALFSKEEIEKELKVVTKQLDEFKMAVAQAGGIDLGSIFGDRGTELTKQKENLDKALFTVMAQDEAQRMLNGNLSIAGGLQKAWLLTQQESKRAQEEANGLIADANQKAIYDETQALAVKDQELKLQQLTLEYGKSSNQVMAQKAEMASLAVEQSLKEKFAKDGISAAEQNIIDQASAQAYLNSQNASLIDQQTQNAQNLAAAFKDVSAAMKGLLSFGDSLDKALDTATIKAGLLKKGIDASTAGTISGMQADLNQKMEAANKAGITPSILSGMFGGDQAKIDELTKLLAANQATEAAGRKSGPSADTLENKLKTLYTYLDKTRQVNKYMTQEEDIAYKQRQSLLEAALKKGLLTREEYNGLEKDLALRHQQELSQINFAEQLKKQQEIFDTVKSSMEDAFMSMVDGTKSAKDAFKSMAAAIIKELYNILVVQRLVGSFNQKTGVGSGIVGALGGLFKGGGAVSHAAVAGFANGGDISAGVPIMVGERGPELIVPKSSGTVLTNGQTKAALGGESYTVHNNITVTGSDSVMVRQEIAKMIPQISSATKAAMIDAKKRGGQMGAAFR